MQIEKGVGVSMDSAELDSEYLERSVKINFYYQENIDKSTEVNLLLVNDGQDLVAMGFRHILEDLVRQEKLKPLLCVGIHCGEDRKNEYGMASSVDYKGRGVKAGAYKDFVLNELMAYVKKNYPFTFSETGFAGFSLGGLSALDIAWNHPWLFSRVGVFSGSLWWRSRNRKDKDFNEFADRLMHQQIRNGKYQKGMKFFFQCSELDESEDRNKNGVIDSIDDTIDLMRELLGKGYMEGPDMVYLQMADGAHDVPTWARALPFFLLWAYGNGA